MTIDQTPPANRNIRRLDRLTNWLLLIILLIPFLISFGALRDLAADNGVSYPWLYPIMIDGGLIIFKAIALRASLRGRRDSFAWAMAVAATVISVGLNVVHVEYLSLPAGPSSLGLARFMAALPPLVILLAFIAVSRRVAESARMETAVWTYGQLQETIAGKRQELDDLISAKTAALDATVNQRTETITKMEAHIARLASEKDDLLSALETLKSDIQAQKLTHADVNLGKVTLEASTLAEANAVRLTQKEAAMRRLLRYLAANPDATMTDAADQIGRSRATVSNYVTELSEAGLLHKNGHGWEVATGA